MNFVSPLASGKVTVIEMRRGQPSVVRESMIMDELPNLLWGRNARKAAIAKLLAAREMEAVINKAMQK